MPNDPSCPEPTRRQWVGYWSMITQQTQNAFNDKMAQFILIPLGGAVGWAVESQAGLMIALPFVLFAPIAGWLSDRNSKRDVMFGSAVLQLLVLIWICGAVMAKNLPLALCGFFALATQAAFFSPAKLGINKELVGSTHLGFATGIQQMTAMLAMLAGQIVAGWLFDKRFHALGGSADTAWRAALGPLLVLTILSVPALVMAWIVPRVPAQDGGKEFTLKLAVSHFVSLSDLWRDAPLRRASFGVAFFWGFAAFINLWSVKLAKVMTGGGEGFGTLSSMFMAAASLGMAAGFGFASYLLRKRIELGWVPVAGLAMTLTSIALALIPPGNAHAFLHLLDTNPLAFVLSSPGRAVFLLTLGLLAFVSALFLAPLNAWMQDHYPAAKRGELQSAVNLQDCFSGIIAVAVITAFELGAKALGIDPLAGFRFQMWFIAMACLLATAMIIRLLPADFLRVLGVTAIRALYRVRVAHPDRLPHKGGVLLLPNHVTYADAFFISAACPRRVRFVMEEAFIQQRAIRIFTRIFDTMTIRRDQPLEAIRQIIRTLENGHVVCMFPEGQLTRTGTLGALQRGFELIAHKTRFPILPVWCDGSWGSIFSFERNRFFRKIPRRFGTGITLAYGHPLVPRQVNLESARAAILTASAEAVGLRFVNRAWLARLPQASNPAAAAFRLADAITRRRFWVNGHQIGMINALQRRQPFQVLQDDPVLTELPGLCAAFADMFRATVVIKNSFNGDENASWVGSDVLRGVMQTTQITGLITFYDFGTCALKPVDRAGVCHCPCLAVDGIVVAMSMPHPAAAPDSFEPQHGHKPHSWGKLLPGWHLTPAPDGTLMARGPAAAHGGLPLPAGCTLDPEGFLMER
jgi:acyl-[acyl-carrier-protein]-phospholipid O-acyltransferase/long-chain-fatty-acid--[acyl-carrier-protein] ligase